MSRIVRATDAHLGTIAMLMASSPLLHRYGVTARGAKASLAEAVREGDMVLAAVDADAVVGFAWVIVTRALDRAAYLRLLIVAETHQSRGVGAALLARAEREARAARCRHLVLLVTKTNRRARSFYQRHGYAHVGDLAGFVRPRIAESLYLKSWRT
jgi:ribosomal protein S18 acetylase RimI-like enzyme